MLIYQAYNQITGRFYVGKTTKTLKHRRNQHYADITIGRMTYFHRALAKYPPDAFEWVQLDRASTLDELNEKERFWIGILRDCGHPVYNMTDGGDGGSKPGKENHRYGKSIPEEQKKRIAQSLREYYKDKPGTMTGVSGEQSPFWRKSHSEDAKAKISAAKKGKVLPHMMGGSNPSARRIICVNTGDVFETATLASQKYNCDLSSIIKCCKGKVKSVKGLQFEYAPGVFGWTDQGPA